MDFLYRGKNINSVGFLGFGKSNEALYSYLKNRFPHLSFTIRDNNKNELPSGFNKVHTGALALSDISEDVLFLSPSVRRDKQELTDAIKKGVILSSDTEFFFENKNSDVFLVTGSDGKSTTTYLASRLFGGKYRRAFAIGNIGEPFSLHINDGADTALVCELSSFQLSYCVPKSKRCVITNITPNHLNWHSSYEEYISAKENVLINAEERVFNYDCSVSQNLIKTYGAHTLISAKISEYELKKLASAKRYITIRDGYITVSGERLFRISDIRAPGRYNLYNFMAAIALAYENTTAEKIGTLAREFSGLSHRFQKVLERDGVTYVDSSIDSSPKRTAATISGAKGNIILILGGRSKGLSFGELIAPICEKVISVIIVGENGKEIENTLTESGKFINSSIPCKRFDDFYDGVRYAVNIARIGETVLLSPASTSFDRFRSFEERGEEFTKFIKKIT